MVLSPLKLLLKHALNVFLQRDFLMIFLHKATKITKYSV